MNIEDYLKRTQHDYELSKSDAEDMIEDFKYEKMKLQELTDLEFKLVLGILKKCSNTEVTYFITWAHMQENLEDKEVDTNRYVKLTKTFPKSMKKIDKVLKKKKIKKLNS